MECVSSSHPLAVYVARGTLGFARLRDWRFFYVRLQEHVKKIAVMRDLNPLRYAVLTVLACGIVGKICKKYGIAG